MHTVIRHHGEFNSSNGLDLDLNKILTSTMKEGLARSWAAFFNKHHFDSLESDAINVIGEFLVELSNEVTLSPIKSFLEKHKDEIIKKARILVRHAIRKVQRQIDQDQKEVGRGLGPQIQKLLMATYIEAGKISGKGCAQAQKVVPMSALIPGINLLPSRKSCMNISTKRQIICSRGWQNFL